MTLAARTEPRRSRGSTPRTAGATSRLVVGCVAALRPAVVCFLLVAVGAMLRLLWFDLMEFKYDEVTVIQLARHWLTHGIPRYGMMSGVGIRNPPGFMFFLVPLVALSGNPLWIGFWVAAANVAATWVLFLAARCLDVPRAGLWAAGFMAVHPWLILYSRKIWAQSLLPLFVTLLLLVLAHCTRRARSRAVFWLGPLVSLAAQVHLSGVCLVPVVGAWGIAAALRRRLNPGMAAWGALAGVLLLVPYLCYVAASGFSDVAATGDAGGAITGVAILRTWSTWARTAFAGGVGYPFAYGMAGLGNVLPGPVGRLLGAAAAFGTIAVFGFAVAGSVPRRGPAADAPLRSFPLWLVLLVTVPPLLYTVRGLESPPHYFILGLPALLLLAGMGVARLSPRHWSLGALGVLVLLGGAAAWLGILGAIRAAGGAAGDYGTALRHQRAVAQYLGQQGVSPGHVDAALTRDRGIGILFFMQPVRATSEPSEGPRATVVNRLMFPDEAVALVNSPRSCVAAGPLVVSADTPEETP